jgi:glc operon protein GlcG
VTNDSFLETAQRAVEAGLGYAREHDLRMTVLVMDVSGTVCAAARMDGSRTITYAIALAKANTAREFQSTTGELAARVKPENKVAIGQLAPNIAFLGGGVPIMRDGAVVGAIGTSGGTEQQDIECADLALAAIAT